MPPPTRLTPRDLLEREATLTTKDLLAVLRITAPTFARWLAEGAFPPPMPGSRSPGRRWSAVVVRRWLEQEGTAYAS